MDSQNEIVFASFNFEQNGFGDRKRRERAYELINEIKPDVLFRQEMNGAGANGRAMLNEAAEALQMDAFLGERSCTGLFVRGGVFTTVEQWPTPHPLMTMPPTAVTAQLRAAGPESMPLILVAGHLSYCSPELRLIEAGLVTTFNDKKRITMPDGSVRRGLMVLGVDANSYPSGSALATGDLPLPPMDEVRDRPHRAHRSRRSALGGLRPDQEPHDRLVTAGLDDVARLCAARSGRRVGATMNASSSHGPKTRVDWIMASSPLRSVWTRCDVVDASEVSDHHIVVARARLSELIAVLAGPVLDVG
ncbi:MULTISPECIES: exonuclease/endonuclease/phosphatase family protein [Streptomycetaceae]|nr:MULTISPECIES: hypothetical protein [Streptomycetaceae]MYS59213.1 hypothetical protein [Streptomyces sp. SID5468]CCB74934.1 conserved protein of unknown function [Streptantibioticus cattleyicolor NRRL 8057 = DSM 46488]